MMKSKTRLGIASSFNGKPKAIVERTKRRRLRLAVKRTQVSPGANAAQLAQRKSPAVRAQPGFGFPAFTQPTTDVVTA